MTDYSHLDSYRLAIRSHMLWDEKDAIDSLTQQSGIEEDIRREIAAKGANLVKDVRETTRPSLMEAFLAEYGLSTKEGLALMCLAEALLRVPDSDTMDKLIEDKIMTGEWADHAGQSISALVNASTMGLQVTSRVLRKGSRGVTKTLKGMVKRLGMPVIRQAVKQVMKELGRQFVLGQTIELAMKEAQTYEKEGFTYSYDMLGEAAYTAKDAEKYLEAYKAAIRKLAPACKAGVRENPGISIKISALHPRYEQVNKDRVMTELTPKILELAEMAKEANMGFNIDAEEVDRLDISLDLITAVLSSETLKGWDGFGIVVQAYGKRASFVLDYLYELAKELDRKIMIRLVKGAYWDAEIKRAQVMGLDGFPVYTRKEHTDISYMACAKKLLSMVDHIYPQFATHNAHTVAAVMAFSKGVSTSQFEFQRLHGMGESLHQVLKRNENTRCRIYAPVGVHRDLLAYLVRRLLENGANSSFVNQIVDMEIPPADVAKDPFLKAQEPGARQINFARDLFGTSRVNSKGFDETDVLAFAEMDKGRSAYRNSQWTAVPRVSLCDAPAEAPVAVINPANPEDCVGTVAMATRAHVDAAMTTALGAQVGWQETETETRCQALEKAADLFEENAHEIFAILTREAGKSLVDAIAELREAVDFLRYYASEMRLKQSVMKEARGVFVCISPWNFPLAIFTGQIAAALVAGNAVVAKPAEQTPLIADFAVRLMHQAGVPETILHLLPGDGATVGAAMTSHAEISGVCFTGSTETAQLINRAMAKNASPHAPLIAETGGLNVMFVDSTALPEQAVRDIVDSSFQSAGQRCSALRMLYVQEDIAPRFLDMLYGAMDELDIGDPWSICTDVGPVIDEEAHEGIMDYIAVAGREKRILKTLAYPQKGLFVPPTVVKVSGIEDLEREIFGPVLHVATYKAGELEGLLEVVKASGYGLTMGLHTRIDTRIDYVRANAAVGNLYVNRNQIGAIVGSQPFGGEGMSGTGPKAGGPEYLKVFQRYVGAEDRIDLEPSAESKQKFIDLQQVIVDLKSRPIDDVDFIRSLIEQVTGFELADWQPQISEVLQILKQEVVDLHMMPSPVGETNELRRFRRGTVLCLGPNMAQLVQQVITALFTGNRVLALCSNERDEQRLSRLSQYFAFDVIPCRITPKQLETLSGIDAVVSEDNDDRLTSLRQALAKRPGKLVPLITDWRDSYAFSRERHCCVDTTASGGDAALLAG